MKEGDLSGLAPSTLSARLLERVNRSQQVQAHLPLESPRNPLLDLVLQGYLGSLPHFAHPLQNVLPPGL